VLNNVKIQHAHYSGERKARRAFRRILTPFAKQFRQFDITQSYERDMAMKKILIPVFVLLLTFTLAGPILAGTPKPPKNACFELDTDGRIFCIGTKKGISLLYGDTKVPMYTVQGAVFVGTPLPVGGTGYMLGDIFIFNFSTSATTNIAITGLWDVVTQTGEAVVNETKTTGFTSKQDTLLLYTFP